MFPHSFVHSQQASQPPPQPQQPVQPAHDAQLRNIQLRNPQLQVAQSHTNKRPLEEDTDAEFEYEDSSNIEHERQRSKRSKSGGVQFEIPTQATSSRGPQGHQSIYEETRIVEIAGLKGQLWNLKATVTDMAGKIGALNARLEEAKTLMRRKDEHSRNEIAALRAEFQYIASLWRSGEGFGDKSAVSQTRNDSGYIGMPATHWQPAGTSPADRVLPVNTQDGTRNKSLGLHGGSSQPRTAHRFDAPPRPEVNTTSGGLKMVVERSSSQGLPRPSLSGHVPALGPSNISSEPIVPRDAFSEHHANDQAPMANIPPQHPDSISPQTYAGQHTSSHSLAQVFNTTSAQAVVLQDTSNQLPFPGPYPSAYGYPSQALQSIGRRTQNDSSQFSDQVPRESFMAERAVDHGPSTHELGLGVVFAGSNDQGYVTAPSGADEGSDPLPTGETAADDAAFILSGAGADPSMLLFSPARDSYDPYWEPAQNQIAQGSGSAGSNNQGAAPVLSTADDVSQEPVTEERPAQ